MIKLASSDNRKGDRRRDLFGLEAARFGCAIVFKVADRARGEIGTALGLGYGAGRNREGQAR